MNVVNGSDGIRTHSILRSKRGWSASCLPSLVCGVPYDSLRNGSQKWRRQFRRFAMSQPVPTPATTRFLEPVDAQNRSRTCRRSGLSRTALPLAYLGHNLKMIPDGLEPSLPGCRPGVFAAGRRDRVVASHAWRHAREKVDPAGVAPASPVCKTSIFLLDDEPV